MMRKTLFLFNLVFIFALVACSAIKPASDTGLEDPLAVQLATEKPRLTLATEPAILPDSSPEAPPTETATPLPQPSNTPAPTPTPEPTQAPPTATPSPIAIPDLVRVLSLQSPALQGEDVLALQEQLLRLGYSEVGTPDGIFGGMTDSAIKRFQTEHDLTVDGVVGPQTWQTLFSQTAAPLNDQSQTGTAISFYRGIEDDQVEMLAERLKTLGYPLCEMDDMFGFQLEFAVRLFQRANDLDPDGIVGPKTWEAIFSDLAPTLAQPEFPFSLSAPVEVGSAYDLTYDGTSIWLADNDFGHDDDWIRKLDPNTGMGLGQFVSPTVGEILGYDGKTYPTYLHAGLVFAHNGMLWLGGRASADTETGTPTFAPVQSSGNLLGKPIFVRTNFVELSAIVDFFEFNHQAWGIANEPEVMLYALGNSSYQVERQVIVYDMFEAHSAAFDGQRLWLAGRYANQSGIWAVNPLNGVVSHVLGACGEDLVYDGQWIWVSNPGRLIAIDPETLDVMGSLTFKGSPVALTSNGRNQIWLLSVSNADYFLQTLKSR